jgi:thiamine kinase
MSADMSAVDALAYVPGWDPGATDVEELKGGLTNRTFLIRAGGVQCVMRLNANSSDVVALDRSCEPAILRHAANAGIAPHIVYSDIDHGILVTEYLPDRVWSAADLGSTRKIDAIANLLRKVHALPSCGARLDMQLTAERYAEYLEKRQGLHAFASHCVDVIASVPAGERVVCCHNDVVAQNIVASSPPKLIDWEYACDNDPLFDLASLIGFHNLDKQAAETFLSAYTGGASGEQRQRLADQLRIFDAIQWLWVACRHLRSPRRANAVRLEELQQRIR